MGHRHADFLCQARLLDRGKGHASICFVDVTRDMSSSECHTWVVAEIFPVFQSYAKHYSDERYDSPALTESNSSVLCTCYHYLRRGRPCLVPLLFP